jgi:Na+-transporting NADH:ubiquinone oxidoreductase subunit NqrC
MEQIPRLQASTDKPIIWRDTILNGKKVVYNNNTTFFIQVGKGKSSYKTKYAVRGSFGTAFTYYLGINIGNGYKKRFLMEKKVLDRRFSS